MPAVAQNTTPAQSPMQGAIELSAIRKVIARRMVESKTTIPHFYITVEIDMTEAMELRERLNSMNGEYRISINDMVVKAVAKALVDVPAVNAAFKDDTIIPGDGVNVGIAVALDDGLIVPVVRDADKLTLRGLSQAGKVLIKKARDKKLLPDDYSGGTFTVSNLGAFEVDNFIAIIDPSQGAILAVSSIVRKPVILDGGDAIIARHRMNATLSGDHRVMDGASGAKFTQALKRYLENPISLLE
jgi:pyruvate dehydrogenase E2 component (dihydrolipoamide acetyltransferase)